VLFLYNLPDDQHLQQHQQHQSRLDKFLQATCPHVASVETMFASFRMH
jgi:hypothetical protein